jgi:hypothetical protein
MQPVTSLRIKSVIASPLDGSQVETGKLTMIRGVAWSGDAGAVTRVDISIDGGRRWEPATLRRDQRTEFGWRQWDYRWRPQQEAYYTILARARDGAGNTQPFDQEWNPSGYGWNVIPRVGVNAVEALSDSIRRTQPSAVDVTPPTALRNACLTCHDVDVIQQQRLTRAQWDLEVNKMIGWGARVNDGDRRALLDFLFSSFGPRPR